MDVDKKYNQNVLKAIAQLQKRESVFIPLQTIIQRVIVQMRRKRMLEPFIGNILKSLKSLTKLGILTRSLSSEYGFHKSFIACNIKKSTKPRLKRRSSSHSSVGSKRSQNDQMFPVLCPTYLDPNPDPDLLVEVILEDSAEAVELNTTLMNSVEMEPKNNPILDEQQPIELQRYVFDDPIPLDFNC